MSLRYIKIHCILDAFYLIHELTINFKLTYSQAGSASVGTSISVGQTSFFNSEATWFPYNKIPSLMTWSEKKLEDPNGDNYSVSNAKNKKALDAYYTTNITAGAMNARDIQMKKSAISTLMSSIPPKEIQKIMKFESNESEYNGLKDGKNYIDCLAIIFSGAYNKGTPCFNEECTPYLILKDNLEYTAVLKENWTVFFPSIVMMQRNTNVLKSTLERFLISKYKSSSKLSNISSSSSSTSSSSSSYVTPIQKTEEQNFNEENLNKFTSYITSTDNTLKEANYLSIAQQQNTASMNEYNLDCQFSNAIGNAIVKRSDSTVIEFEFNVVDTSKLSRRFVGVSGTHEWKIFKSFEKLGAFSVVEGDYVVVLGIRGDTIHIQDPTYSGSSSNSEKIRTFLIPTDNFFPSDMHLTPESL